MYILDFIPLLLFIFSLLFSKNCLPDFSDRQSFTNSFLILFLPPSPDYILRRFHASPMDRQPLFHLGSRAQAADIRFAAPQPAAFMGAEGKNDLPGEVKVFRKSKHRHGPGPPVIRIAQINPVIWLQAGRMLPGFCPSSDRPLYSSPSLVKCSRSST